MSFSVNSIDSYRGIQNLKQVERSDNVGFRSNLLNGNDTVQFTAKRDLTVQDKQKIIKKARVKATGWSIFGGLFSTAYYAFRSDEKIARKYGLDMRRDRNFIKQIKHDQTMYSIIGTLPVIGGLIGYCIVKSQNPNNILVQ